jgi:photosystem II stability/assembly factor-like uncharacterized protein
MTGGSFLSSSNSPPGELRRFQQLPSIANFGPGDYVVVTSTGVFITSNIAAASVVWTELGASTSPANACGIQVSRAGTDAIFYVKSGGCDGDRGGRLFHYDGTDPGQTWQQIVRTGDTRFGVYDVDPDDADRVIASDLTDHFSPEMVMTTDGGAIWQNLTGLDDLMTGSGVFHYTNHRGPKHSAGSPGYPQPTLVAFDPAEDNLIVAGAADAGVFVSTDAGNNWRLVSDPHTPSVSNVAHIPRPRYARFDRDQSGTVRVYLGTKGRGVWRLTLDAVNP